MAGGGDTNIQRLMALFEGHAGAHGTHGEPVLDGLKWAIKTTARTLREPPTAEMWGQHLRGERPLGIIPIREDSSCLWGSIDIDIYDADLLSVVAGVQAARLPLVPCRSKSGGLHLFLFLSDPQPAASVRTVLRDVAARLGIAKKADGNTDIEIFPVQSQVLTERRDVGNWMVMPYFGGTFGGRLRHQAGVKHTGAEQTLGEFLSHAERLRLAQADFEGLLVPLREAGGRKANGASPPRPFSDGPVCLEHMLAEGAKLMDGRKRALFMMGLYYKRADPAGWRRRLEEANGLFFEPPLPSEEVTGVVRSLSKKEYEYTCQVEPMVAHCDSKRCCVRKYGVGRGGLYPVITGLSKLDTDPPVWFLDVDDMRVEASTEQLLEYRAMMRLFAARGNRVFRVMKQTDWVDALIEPMENVVVIDVPADAGPHARLHELLQDFLVNRWRGEAREDLLRGKPWHDVEKGRQYFRLQDLQRLLDREKVHYERGQIVSYIRSLGGSFHQLNIEDHCVASWWVPDNMVEATPQLAVPVPKGDGM